MSEHLENKHDVRVAYDELLVHEPKPISVYVPLDAASQKKAFLLGENRNPSHAYDKLDAIDFASQDAALQEIGETLLFSPELPDKHRMSYEQFITNYRKKTELLRRASVYNHATTDDDKLMAAQEYMTLNKELYGAPDETTYRSLLQDKLTAVEANATSKSAQQLYSELQDMLPDAESAKDAERFKPSPETVAWMHEVAVTLYGGMLSHIPEQDIFTPGEVQRVFSEIIHHEFGEAATTWRVDVEPAQSLNVKASEKRIVIPEHSSGMSYKALRRMVVHEIGVHMMRSVTGESTDLAPLQTGLNDYYDAEEGLGVVMEQALESKFAERGVDHYITAGMAGMDGMDFRQTFECKWRIAALGTIKEGQDITEEITEKAKNTAYSQTMRSFRGTDDLPWFKDLAYYNGSVDMWRHLEKIRGDDVKFMFVLLGKADPSKIEHERILYETKSIQ